MAGLKLVTYTQADDVTAEVELSLFNDMDGPRLLLLYLNQKAADKKIFKKLLHPLLISEYTLEAV